jgi:hypothetical protein
MSIDIVNESHAHYLITDGDDWNDFIESVEDHFEVYGDNHQQFEFVKMFDDIESFYDEALEEMYGVSYFSEMFSDGSVEVNDRYFRDAYRTSHEASVVEDLYGHTIYIVREV